MANDPNEKSKALSGASAQWTDWLSSNSDVIAKVVGTFTGSIFIQSRIDDNDTDIVDVEEFTAPGQKISDIRMKKSLQYRIGVKASGLASGTPTVYIIR